MLPSMLFFQLTAIFAVVNCLPLQPKRRSTYNESDGMGVKLKRLRTLLEKLEEAKITKSNLTKDLKEYAKHEGGRSDETVQEIVDSGESSDASKNTEEIISLKNFVDTLTPEEVQKLKMLKSLVEESTKGREEGMLNKGSFSEKEVPDSDDMEVINWKELAKRLENERDNLYLQNLKQVKQPLHIETETKEGTFGAFRDEIKYAVEKNLLTDVALAMHSGITVDELLKDITGKGGAKQ